MARNKTDRDKRRASNVLTAFNILFLVAGIAIIVKIASLQFFWEPNPDFISYFRPKQKAEVLEPERGSIIDRNGRLLAMSTPMYNIYMDCYVMKEAHDNDEKSGKEKEAEWCAKAENLAKGLSEVLEDGKSADYYRNLIFNGRRNKRRYVPITKGIDHGTLLELKELPLFNDRRTYYSGMIVEKADTRQYPYDELARRVIGYVRNNSDTSRYKGIEGIYDYVLHGKKGLEWKKVTDKWNMIQDADSSVIAKEDGIDIRTTIDINMQDIADKALRKNMAQEKDIVGGCVVILEVETGAVRAMVNLSHNKEGVLGEFYNLAACRFSEPGSVFKAVTMTTLLEDGYVTLDQEIPTKRGIMEDMPHIARDPYIQNYERNTKKKAISVLDGFKISSNYVFRRLVKDNYGERPKEFINRLHEFNFGDAYQFPLTENDGSRPSIPDPLAKSWTIYDLVSVAIGYTVKTSPLQIATFYNAIANDGKMMKPYIVENTEHNGKVIQKFEPTVLNGSICSKATADTLTRALTMVTLEGTASRLKNAKCTVAGKTGTSRIVLSAQEQKGSGKSYEDIDGRKKHQATFVGFFPAEEPKYTAIVVVYTGLMDHDVYGGNIPALTFKDIADELWAYEDGWGDELKPRGSVPQMRADHISISKAADTPVPDVKGLGLKDAIYAIENNGYRCRHSGTGHVASQSPKAGSGLKKGETVSIVLK